MNHQDTKAQSLKTRIKYLLVLVLAGFVFVGCTTTNNGDSKVKHWEYKVAYLNVGDQIEIDAELKKLGNDGWNLVSITPIYFSQSNVSQSQYTFKRPKQ